MTWVLVAQAWAIVVPVMPGMPIIPATHGEP